MSDALFLDFDGTLVEIAAHPDFVSARGELPGVLEGLRRRLGDAIALVSGRAIADFDQKLAPFRSAAVGLHGIELRRSGAGSIERTEAPSATAAVAELEREIVGMPGVWVEDKASCAALHFRAAPHAIASCGSIAAKVAARHGLQVLSGKMVFELRPHGVDKGSAVAALMGSAPFRGRRPIVVGDDVTDEDAFAAAQELGGVGIKVGPGATVATARLADVREVRAWLEANL